MPTATASPEQSVERHGLSEEVYYKEAPLGGPSGVKQVDVENRTMEGFSAGIGNEDQGGDIIMPGAFRKTISERVANGNVKLLDQHSPHSTDNVWGKVIEAEERALSQGEKEEVADILDISVDEAPSHRLWSKFFISQKPRAQNALKDVQDGILDGLSIGFRTVRVEFEADEEIDLQDEGIDAEIAWLRGMGIRKIHELAWWETSLVVWPMNRAAMPIPSSVMSTLSKVADLDTGESAPSEKQVRYAIRALESMLGDDDQTVERALSADALEGVAEKLDQAIEEMKKEDAVPQDAQETLEALYHEYSEKRDDSVTTSDFVEWVETTLKEEDTEDEKTTLYEIPYSDMKVLSTARDPCFSSTEPGEVPDGWPPSLDDFIEANGWDAESWEDLSEDQKDAVVCTSLLGETDETFEASMMFPVVDENGSLRENALRAVLSGRGAQADISEDALDSARNKAEGLLENEFDADIDDDEEASASASNTEEKILGTLKELNDLLKNITEENEPDESDQEDDDPTPEADDEVAGASEDEDEAGGGESEEGRSDERFEDREAREVAAAALARLQLSELED